jgi:hypothetical protein
LFAFKLLDEPEPDVKVEVEYVSATIDVEPGMEEFKVCVCAFLMYKSHGSCESEKFSAHCLEYSGTTTTIIIIITLIN